MKKFFVSKSDSNRVAFIKDAIQKIKPSNIYILCEKDRASVYSGIDALLKNNLKIIQIFILKCLELKKR